VERALVELVSFEILDALAELVVLPSEVLERCAEQRLGFGEAFVDTGLVLSISPFHEGREPLGHKPDLVTKIFDQDAAVALALFDPVIYLIEAAVNPFESPVDLLEPLIQPMNKPMKAFIEALNKFLIHTASAVKWNSKPCSLSCQ
jgi:hypothetical protein